jgi:Kef-type K+ transport system membrane component KefB
MLLAVEPNPWERALRHLEVENLLLPLLVQLILIILAARLFATLFRRLGQPAVVGEIAAGLILGPSVLGRLFPDLFAAVFHPAVHGLEPELSEQLLRWVLTTLSQLGLIFLLFLIGLEFDFDHLRWHGKSALAISLAGLALPFSLGVGLAYFMRPHVGVPEERALGFALFLGTALSITAIPILGRMMMELGITRTRLGAITISAAAVDDAAGWILLATVAAVVGSGFRPAQTLVMVGATVTFGLGMVYVGRPLLRRWARWVLRVGGGELTLNSLAVLLAVVLLCAIATNLIGIFAIFGAFVLGAVLSDEHAFREAVARRLRDLVTAFFLPIFFAYTGLRTNVGSLDSGTAWLFCGLVSAAAIVGKLGGCTAAAWLSRFSFRESLCIGTMMNTRALMALIVINLGKDLRVIPDSVFCMLILMALATTIMTTPVLLRIMHGTELEPYIRRSGFLGPVPADAPAEPTKDPAVAAATQE